MACPVGNQAPFAPLDSAASLSARTSSSCPGEWGPRCRTGGRSPSAGPGIGRGPPRCRSRRSGGLAALALRAELERRRAATGFSWGRAGSPAPAHDGMPASRDFEPSRLDLGRLPIAGPLILRRERPADSHCPTSRISAACTMKAELTDVRDGATL